MPVRDIGAQGASAGSIRRSSPGTLRRTLAVAIALALLAIAAAPLSAAVPRTQAAGDAPKAVIIVGPTGGTTAYYLEVAKQIANQAEAAGMDVRRIFHPRATAQRVLANIQGAKFVLYLGHGNGWPSPYAPFQERTKNGFGLNAVEGGSASKHTYYGANWIRANVKLGAKAVVMLIGACYSSGNGESGMPIPSLDIARQRVDNFAAGFLAAGAGVVYAFGWQQKLNFAQQLMSSNKTFDEIFMTPSNGSPSGGIGWKDRRLASQRTPGAVNHLDPHPSQGYYRAASGWLDTKASAWRGSDGGDSVEVGAAATTPSVPGNLKATPLGYRRVELTWQASTSSAPGSMRYRIFRNGTRIATVTELSYIDRPATAGTYSYKIRALDRAGRKSAFTPLVTVKAVKGAI